MLDLDLNARPPATFIIAERSLACIGDGTSTKNGGVATQGMEQGMRRWNSSRSACLNLETLLLCQHRLKIFTPSKAVQVKQPMNWFSLEPTRLANHGCTSIQPKALHTLLSSDSSGLSNLAFGTPW